MALRLRPSVLVHSTTTPFSFLKQTCSLPNCSQFHVSMSSTSTDAMSNAASPPKVIDSHLHVWASSKEASEKYPYFPGQEPTLIGHAEFLIQCMEEAGVDGALIVQPINHKFDHSYVTSVLKRYPSKFSGCCLANPADDGSGIGQLEDLVSKDGYCAVRFNPYLWPSGQKMTNKIGKALFRKAGELGIAVGFMCMKGLNLHISEIEELCTEYPSTTVLIDHLGFCKPPTYISCNDDESLAFSNLLKLAQFPQVKIWIILCAFLFVWLNMHRFSYCYALTPQAEFKHLVLERIKLFYTFLSDEMLQVHVKFSALFRISREQFPYQDLSSQFSRVVSSFGANRIMWGSDFPFVISECGYKEAKEAVSLIAKQAGLSTSDLNWITGGTIMKLFQGHWVSS